MSIYLSTARPSLRRAGSRSDDGLFPSLRCKENDVDEMFVLVGVLLIVSHEKTGGNDVDEIFVLVGVLVMVCLVSTWEQQGKWEQVVPTKLA